MSRTMGVPIQEVFLRNFSGYNLMAQESLYAAGINRYTSQSCSKYRMNPYSPVFRQRPSSLSTVAEYVIKYPTINAIDTVMANNMREIFMFA